MRAIIIHTKLSNLMSIITFGTSQIKILYINIINEKYNHSHDDNR